MGWKHAHNPLTAKEHREIDKRIKKAKNSHARSTQKFTARVGLWSREIIADLNSFADVQAKQLSKAIQYRTLDHDYRA